MAIYDVIGFPGYTAIQEAIKSGTAKIVDAYPKSVVRGGYWETDYSDTPVYGADQEATKVLSINGKMIQPTNDWTMVPITRPGESVQTGVDDFGTPQYMNQQVPTGAYRIRSRADNNVFNEMIVGADQNTGTFTGYNPNIFQTGSNSGFGGGALGGFISDIATMAQTTAPLWMGALSAGLSSGLAGATGAETGLLSSEAGALGAVSDLAPVATDSSLYSLSPGVSSGTGLAPTIGEGTNLFSTGTNVGTDALGTGLTLPETSNLASMGGGQGLTVPAAGGGLLGEAGVGSAVTAVTNPVTGQPMGQELSNINTGVTDVAGTPISQPAQQNPLQNQVIRNILGSLMPDNTNTNLTSLGGGLLTGAGGAIQGEAARAAAQQIADRMASTTGAAVSGAQFRPVGITTRFGSSNFQVNPQTGQLESAGITPSALSEQLQQGAQGVYNLGRGYVAQSPQEAAQSWLSAQQALLAPSRDVALSNLRNQVFQSGREGLSMAQGGNLQAANPELAAYYNSLANQNALLASQAQQFGQQQAQFGTGLLGSGLNLMSGLNTLEQQPLALGAGLGSQAATAGAQAGRLGIGGTQAGQDYLYKAASYSPFGNLLSAAGSSPLGSQVAGNLLSQYAPQLANYITGLFAPTGGVGTGGTTDFNFWSY